MWVGAAVAGRIGSECECECEVAGEVMEDGVNAEGLSEYSKLERAYEEDVLPSCMPVSIGISSAQKASPQLLFVSASYVNPHLSLLHHLELVPCPCFFFARVGDMNLDPM